MIQIIDKSNCCGCGACVTVCPKKCISMEADVEGFLYPKANLQLCVNCGLCEKTCPILKRQTDCNAKPEAVYISFSKKKELREMSSSGGLFPVLAESVLKRNGTVFGAAFDDQFLVHHIGISDYSELPKLQGSKYIQSRTESTFAEAKNALDHGRLVLFSGTACQIAGLKAFLNRDYEQLITIDVLCHGTPSPQLWKQYMKECEEEFGSPVNFVSFRNKNNGWKDYSLVMEFQNGSVYKNSYTKDPFMRLFLSDICLRPSCHSCKYKTMDRPSDISLGDCWGVESHSPEMDDDLGTSVVVVHSLTGQKLYDLVKADLHDKEVKLDIALPPSADSRKSVQAHPNRDKFFRFIQASSVKKSLKFIEAKKSSYPVRIKRKLIRLIRKLL